MKSLRPDRNCAPVAWLHNQARILFTYQERPNFRGENECFPMQAAKQMALLTRFG